MSRQPHGQGAATLYKESFMAMCLGWYMGQVWREEYYHIDLNAGPGHNDKIAMPTVGTPITFMRQTQKHRERAVMAWFIEKNPLYVAMLEAHIRRDFANEFMESLFDRPPRTFQIKVGDNERALGIFAKQIPHRLAPGSVVWDPNGYTRRGGAVSLPVLQQFLEAFPRFIVLVNFPWAFALFGRPVHTNRNPSWSCPQVKDFLPLRRYWLVSEIAQRQLFLCGSAWQFPDGRKGVPAFQHTSKEGRSILERVDTPKDRSRGRMRRVTKIPFDDDEVAS